MTALPPPQPQTHEPQSGSPFLPPVLPRQTVLAPLPPRAHFYDGYGIWHWAALLCGLIVLAVIFGPALLSTLGMFG